MNKNEFKSVAIDGPAGVGKGTVGRLLAQKLNYAFLSSGELYRAVAYFNLQLKLSLKRKYKTATIKPATQKDDVLFLIKDGAKSKYMPFDKITLQDFLERFSNLLQVRPYGNNMEIFLGGINITDKIHTAEVSNITKNIAQNPHIRKIITQIQHDIAAKHNLVLEGRDIGTVVLPNADYKFYLNASAQERGLRRYIQDGKKAEGDNLIKMAVAYLGTEDITTQLVKEDGWLYGQIYIDPQYKKTVEEIKARDKADKNREHSPLLVPKDALEVNTDNFTQEEVVQVLHTVVEKDMMRPDFYSDKGRTYRALSESKGFRVSNNKIEAITKGEREWGFLGSPKLSR